MNITVHNIHSSSAIFPVGGCWSWEGDNAYGYSQFDNWANTGDSSYIVSIDKTAPTTPGTHFITFAAGAYYHTENLFASKCGSSYPSSSDWNNGNDIADLGVSSYNTANSQHWVSIAGDGGCTCEPGVAMIKVNVASGDHDVIYVDKDDGTCGDNAPCYTSIQQAINAASNGDTIKGGSGEL